MCVIADEGSLCCIMKLSSYANWYIETENLTFNETSSAVVGASAGANKTYKRARILFS